MFIYASGSPLTSEGTGLVDSALSDDRRGLNPSDFGVHLRFREPADKRGNGQARAVGLARRIMLAQSLRYESIGELWTRLVAGRWRTPARVETLSAE